jgi:hypothetical protein
VQKALTRVIRELLAGEEVNYSEGNLQ